MEKQPNNQQIWCVVRLAKGKQIDVVYYFTSPTHNPEVAFQSLPVQMQNKYKKGYIIKPYPKRLNVHEEIKLTFEIPGLKNENTYTVEVHERFANIGFEYSPGVDTDEYLGEWAPVSMIKKLANLVTGIFNELKLKPKRVVVGIQENNRIGGSAGYGGWAIISRDGIIIFPVRS